jgi:alkylhydroperoxidase family enzyme
MKLTIHSQDTAPEASRPTMTSIADELGFVPNLAATAAESPALLDAFDGLRRAAATADLDPVLREIAGLAAGVVVDNAYGVAFHSTVLDRLGVFTSEVDTMRAGVEPLNTTWAAVYTLARTVVEHRGAVPSEILDRARGAGMSDEAILDIVAECAFASLVGTIDNLAGRVELDAFLAPRAWTR